MEENNDFEKYDGHEESIETLLGTNEKSSSMTSRERVDDVLENEGAEVLSKYGVPKGLAKKVIKKDGGTFAPTHGPTQKLAKEYSRNKLAKGLDKIDSFKQKKGGYNKSYNSKEAFQRKLEDKNYYKNQINDAKNRQESASNNLDKSKENEKTEKKELKQAKKDERNAKRDNFKSKSYMASHPVEATEMAISNAAKKLGRKILIAIAPYAIGLILLILMAFFVIQLILGPIMEAWGYIDEAITGVANFSEKLTNFYYGFGFQDSKEAFYDELDELCDKYTCSNDGTGLDVPMLLATLFYTEGMGYDTAYGSIEDSDVIDKTSSGTNSGAFGAIKEWLREKYDESKETVDEDGLTYNAGKIYRLRKLARNQFYTNSFGLTERRGQIKTTTLSNFLEKYSLNIAHDISDMLKDFIGLALKSFTGPSTFNEVYAVATGSKYTGDYFYDLANKAGDFKETFKTLISDIFYGLADITDIKIELVGDDGLLTVNISYREFEYDEDNYKNYLTKYYFEHMPEFKKMLNGLKGENREIKKEQLFNDIKSNKNLFESIFLENISKSSENYVDSCLGAIDQNLVSELGKPVDIADNATISFSDSYSYGVVDGKNHNGVDLNETTSGVKLGSNVYSVSNGKIESIEDSKCSDNKNNCGKSIVISHSIIVNSKEFKFKTVYSNITPKTGIGKGNKISKGDIIGTIYNNTNNKEGLHFAFLDLNNDSKGIFIDPTNLFIECKKNSTVLTGDSNEEKTWNYLLGKGFTKYAAAGIIGNLMAETGLKPNNVEDASQAEALYGDEKFTEMIDNGIVTRSEFIQSSKYGVPAGWGGYNYNGLTYGYGLAQWTDPTRKGNFYDSWIGPKKGVSIGDLGVQLNFIMTELESDSYSYIKSTINNASSASAAADIFWNYEVGAAEALRRNYATDVYNRLSKK